LDDLCDSFDHVCLGFGQQLHFGRLHSLAAAVGAGGIGNQLDLRA